MLKKKKQKNKKKEFVSCCALDLKDKYVPYMLNMKNGISYPSTIMKTDVKEKCALDL